jgi:hypothetical protein
MYKLNNFINDQVPRIFTFKDFKKYIISQFKTFKTVKENELNYLPCFYNILSTYFNNSSILTLKYKDITIIKSNMNNFDADLNLNLDFIFSDTFYWTITMTYNYIIKISSFNEFEIYIKTELLNRL